MTVDSEIFNGKNNFMHDVHQVKVRTLMNGRIGRIIECINFEFINNFKISCGIIRLLLYYINVIILYCR